MTIQIDMEDDIKMIEDKLQKYHNATFDTHPQHLTFPKLAKETEGRLAKVWITRVTQVCKYYVQK